MDKTTVLHALLASLGDERDSLVRLLEAARDEATHGESRPENQYDTRALEASYLAVGQGERLEAIDRLIGWVRLQGQSTQSSVGDGALVQLESEEGEELWVLVAPEGGSRVEVANRRVDVISKQSPLGKALSGLEEGDGASVERPNGWMEWEVVTVQ